MLGTTRIGVSLSSEEHDARTLTHIASLAAEYGFEDLVISDHFHPWNHAQGQSPFVWSVIGAIAATTDLRVGTAVTCPTIRIHPAVIAQAAATANELTGGRFFLGLGSGEFLNEHILGDAWPPTDIRLEMLEEAVDVLRGMWKGDVYSHRGTHYRVDDARIFTRLDPPPPIHISGFGPKAIAFAARIGDGFINTSPDADAVNTYRDAGGRGPAIATLKCCWSETTDDARKAVHHLWPNLGLPGELAQELRTPEHFEQASELVDIDTAVGSLPCGPDPEPHIQTLRATIDAGYDEVYLHQIGTEQEPFLRFYRDEVLPAIS